MTLPRSLRPRPSDGEATLKGLIDGLVDAKVVPDDAEPHLTVHMPRLAPLNGGRPRVVLELRAKEAPLATSS